MKMKGSYKWPAGCSTRPWLVCDMKMKGSYKNALFIQLNAMLVCDMKMKGSYKPLPDTPIINGLYVI